MARRSRAEIDVAREALARAQDTVYAAMEAGTKRGRASLARKALAISPLCADAYVVLAGDEASPEAAASLYRQGVEAGEKAIGPQAFDDDVGLFWGLLETRPYMRARHGLALSLWETGERDEAARHALDLLRLNPGDNQGVRYGLLDWLIELGRETEAEALLARYGDEASAAWTWSRALLTFRRHGDGAAARAALGEAREENAHVAPLLLGHKRLPKAPPPFYSPGEASEAVMYAFDGRDAWTTTPGALDWLASAIDSVPKAAPADPVEARIDRAVLALLLLGRHDGDQVWKTFDWAAMNRLHAAGLITDPVGKAKSVALTDKGARQAAAAFAALFGEANG